jgi:hypothetical protein
MVKRCLQIITNTQIQCCFVQQVQQRAQLTEDIAHAHLISKTKHDKVYDAVE